MKFIPMILLSLLPLLAYAQKEAKLQGAWEIVSQKLNGVDRPIKGRQVKLITKNHFMWIHQDVKTAKELLAKGTVADSLLAFHDVFGAGTYKLKGNTYTETTEFFYDPENIGTSIDFDTKIDGNTWTITGHFAHYSEGKKTSDEVLEEVWKRID